MKRIIVLLLICVFTVSGTFAQKVTFGKISKEALAEKKHPLDSLAEAAYLFKKKEVFIEYTSSTGWSLVTLVHERVKIYKKTAASYATESISLFKRGGTDEVVNSIKAYTYNLEGNKIRKEKLQKSQIFEKETSENWFTKSFTMPNIKDGSIVEYKYRKNSPYFQHIDKFDLQHNVPINQLDVLVKIPEYFKYKTHHSGYLQMYFNEELKNKRIRYSYRTNNRGQVGANTTKHDESLDLKYKYYSLTKSNIPAFNNKEAYIPSVSQYKSSVKFELNTVIMPDASPRYYATSWKDVAKRIYKSAAFGEQLQKSGYYKEALQGLLVGKTSEISKMMAVFNFVKTKMKWNRVVGKYTTNGVRKAFKESSGNVAEINLMLTSMLRDAGLNANPVLVSTRSNGVPMFPTIQGFNYVVSSVMLTDGSFAMLDATDPYSLPNQLPIRTINWNGRLVKKDGTSIAVNLVPKSLSTDDKIMNVKIDADGLVLGMMRSKLTGYNAYTNRLKYNHVKEEQVRAKVEEEYAIEIENFRVVNKTKIGKPISEMMKFSSEDLVEKIGGKLYVEPLLFLTKRANPFKLEERKFPVDFTKPWQEKYTVSIQIPEGYSVQALPEATAISMSDDFGVFKFQATQTGNKIKVLSIVQFNKAIVTPEYYQELKEFYKRLVKKQTEKIILIKK